MQILALPLRVSALSRLRTWLRSLARPCPPSLEGHDTMGRVASPILSKALRAELMAEWDKMGDLEPVDEAARGGV